MAKRIFVAGHNGMVGSAIVRRLQSRGDVTLVTRSRAELDLTLQQQVSEFLADEHIDEVYLCAAKVGGIHANNTYPAEFIYENLAIQCNVIHSAWRAGIEKLLFLGSSCIYPRLAEQPMPESALLTGALEPTNEPYAIAKIAGIKLCESYNRQYGVDYRCVMPTNLYGPGDNFHPTNSHVVPALIRRIHTAKQQQCPQVTVWGTGRPRREFLHVDDMASACEFVMSLDKQQLAQATQPMQSHINIGCGQDHTITELVSLICEVVGYQGGVTFDLDKPDGAPRKLLDTSRLTSLGWAPTIELKIGLESAYRWFVEHKSEFK